MKKLILTALLALASLLPAQALEKGVCGFDSPEAMDGNTFAPSSACNAYSRSQSIYTKDQLQGLYNVTSDGITKAKISKITFLVKDETGGHYNFNGTEEFRTTVFIQNTDLEAIPQANGKYLYTDYSQSVSGTATVNYETEAWLDFCYNGGVFEFTIELDQPLVYEGKSLLLTWIGNSQFTETTNWGDGTAGALTDHYATIYEANDRSAYADVSGSVSSDDVYKYFPALKFTYEEEVEKLGPTVTPGRADVYTTVDYDNPDTGNESSGAILPHDAQRCNKSFCQTLYTSEDLKGLNGLTLSGEDIKAKITALTFKISGGDATDGYYDGQFNSTVYIQNIDKDVTDFPVKDGTQYWFDNYTDGTIGHMTNTYEGFVSLPLDLTVTFDENNPFIYEGGSVLITWISEGTIADYNSNGFYSQVFTGAGHSAVISDYSNTSSTTGAFTKYKTFHSSNLPVLKIDYVPLTYSGGEAKTQIKFANAHLGVAAATYKDGSETKEANNVYVEFDIEDAANCGSYDIYLGTSINLGTINGTHGIVNFLPKFINNKALADQVLYVKPHNDVENVLDGQLDIKAADIDAMFTAPVITETVGTMMYGDYDITAKTVNLQGAAALKVTTSAPAAAINFGDNTTDPHIMSHDQYYKEYFDNLIPPTATTYAIACIPYLNDGVISFYKDNTTQISVVRHEPQTENLSGYISLKPTAAYVCLTGATLTTDAPIATTTTKETKTISRTAKDNYSVRFNAETPMEFVINGVGGSEAIEIEEDDEYLTFYHNKAESLQYRLEPTQPEEPGINALAEEETSSSYDNSHEWTTAEKGYINLNLQENKGNKVFVRTVDTKGNARLTAYREIKADGTTSGVADIDAADAADAEYFNLQGIRVSGELTPGIYIRRQGTTATKVTVK